MVSLTILNVFDTLVVAGNSLPQRKASMIADMSDGIGLLTRPPSRQSENVNIDPIENLRRNSSCRHETRKETWSHHVHSTHVREGSSRSLL